MKSGWPTRSRPHCPDARATGQSRLSTDFGRGADCLARMLLRFGVSHETLVYRLHNLRIINAQGRDRLRRISWASLIEHVSDDETARSLLAARGARPERRPPALLAGDTVPPRMPWTERSGAGPLARLLDVGVDDMIEAINSIGPEAADAIDSRLLDPRGSSPDIAILSFDEDPVAA